MEIRISNSPHGREILLMMRELSAMPESQLHSELEALNTSIYTLDLNFVELEKFLLEVTTNPKWDYLFQIENRESLHSISREIVRRLHNFVAAVLSLREHALATYDGRYRDTNLLPEYKGRAREVFGDDPLAQFVMGLRKYCQHYRSPHIGFRTQWEEASGEQRRTAIIFTEDLQTFEKWSAPAKVFISSLDPGADIIEVCRAYRAKVFGFYEWFQVKQNSIHHDELARFREKEAHVLSLQLEDMLDRCIASGDNLHCSEQALFFHIFLRPDYEALGDQLSFSARAEKAIELIEQRFPISDVVKDKIRAAYSTPGFRVYLTARPSP